MSEIVKLKAVSKLASEFFSIKKCPFTKNLLKKSFNHSTCPRIRESDEQSRCYLSVPQSFILSVLHRCTSIKVVFVFQVRDSFKIPEECGDLWKVLKLARTHSPCCSKIINTSSRRDWAPMLLAVGGKAMIEEKLFSRRKVKTCWVCCLFPVYSLKFCLLFMWRPQKRLVFGFPFLFISDNVFKRSP